MRPCEGNGFGPAGARMMSEDRGPNRRDAMKVAIGGALATALPAARGADQKARAPELIVRGGNPLNAETPVELLDSYLTPLDRFFVRSHFGALGAVSGRV